MRAAMLAIEKLQAKITAERQDAVRTLVAAEFGIACAISIRLEIVDNIRLKRLSLQGINLHARSAGASVGTRGRAGFLELYRFFRQNAPS